jgi:hypothetical protein
MDAKTYDDDHGGQSNYSMLTQSALHFRISFKDDGSDGPTPPPYPPGDNTLRGLYIRRRHLDLDSEMPVELAELLFLAMDRAYDTTSQGGLRGFPRMTPDIIRGGDGRPRPDAIQTAYLMLFRYFKHAMLDGFNHEKPAPPDVFPNLDFPQLTDPHDDPPGEGDDDMDFLDWILAILRFIFWLAAIALWLVTVLPAIILDVATYLPRLAAYYGIQLPLYYILKAQRSVMVMTGYLLPMQDEIELSLIRLCAGRRDIFHSLLQSMDDVLTGFDDTDLAAIQAKVDALINASNLTPQDALAQILGELALSSSSPTEPLPDKDYPHIHPPDEYHHPWRYPTSAVELDPTFAGPFPCDSLPHILLEDNVPGSQRLRGSFERARTPKETDTVSFNQVTDTNNLGDPINFTSYLIWQLTRTNFPRNNDVTRIADWNLDADRGYAYKCWDWNRHAPPKQSEPKDEAHHVLRDQDGHDYLEPCTPPPQAEPYLNHPEPYQEDQPLALHYMDQPDPGCTKKD